MNEENRKAGKVKQEPMNSENGFSETIAFPGFLIVARAPRLPASSRFIFFRMPSGFVPEKTRRFFAGFLPLVMLCAFFNTACSTPHAGVSGPAAIYLVTAEQTPFYKNGPAQGNGADLSLKKGEMLTMLDRHYGFSRVQMGDGQTGYVSTDDIGPAPQVPESEQQPKKSAGFRHTDRAPNFEQPNDAALPSVQPSSDVPAPSFRY